MPGAQGVSHRCWLEFIIRGTWSGPDYSLPLSPSSGFSRHCTELCNFYKYDPPLLRSLIHLPPSFHSQWGCPLAGSLKAVMRTSVTQTITETSAVSVACPIYFEPAMPSLRLIFIPFLFFTVLIKRYERQFCYLCSLIIVYILRGKFFSFKKRGNIKGGWKLDIFHPVIQGLPNRCPNNHFSIVPAYKSLRTSL